MFSVSAQSDVGILRHSNQDSGYAGRYLVAVADGMGGHAGGDVASHIAITHLASLDREFATIAQASKALKAGILEANKMIVDVVDTYPQLAGLGTTLSAMLRVGNALAVAHIGDSRIYRQRGETLEQLTNDHTFVQRLIDTGQITIAEAAVHPRRSVLMRVLGDVDATPNIDVFREQIEPGDTWLLCSDGLTGVLDDAELSTLMSSNDSLDMLTTGLIRRTLDEGAPDNVTVVAARISETESTDESHAVFVGSASAANPLKTLPTMLTLGGADVKRTKAPSLPITTGGIPITPSADAHQSQDAKSEAPSNQRQSGGLLGWLFPKKRR